MKFCFKCGNQLVDNAIFCSKCGCAVVTQTSEGVNKNLINTSRLGIVAYVFMLISTILMGFWLIPLSWALPMTIVYFNKITKGEKIETGFKVCCLLFVSLIAGILMLCDKGQNCVESRMTVDFEEHHTETLDKKIAELKHLKELGVITEEQFLNAVRKNVDLIL